MIILERRLWQGRARGVAHLLDRGINEKLIEMYRSKRNLKELRKRGMWASERREF